MMPALSRRSFHAVIVAGLLAFAGLVAPRAAMANPLDDALRAGLVGETPRGYIAAVQQPPSANVTALVNDINSRRRAKYEAIARNRGVGLDQVEALAGQRIIERAPAGTWVKDSTGAWRRK